MRGVFTSRPSIPKYCFTWDVSVVLAYLTKLSPPKALSLLLLSCKLTMLLLLLSGQRGQSIHLLKLEDTDCNNSLLTLRFTSLLKQSAPGRHTHEISLPAFSDAKLCVVATFQEYVRRTKPLRTTKNTKLFITSTKPHKDVARDTLSNWVKRVLKYSGIDIRTFGSHSTRSAATSAAAFNKLPLASILKSAGWQKESTFRKFYDRPITRDTSFADNILSSANKA